MVFATPSVTPFSKLLNKLPVKISYKSFVVSLEQVVKISLMKAIQGHKIARIKHLWTKAKKLFTGQDNKGKL